MNTTTTLPGLKAAHQIITPECRRNRTSGGAFLEAVQRIETLYRDLVKVEANTEVKWHLVLIREEPEA